MFSELFSQLHNGRQPEGLRILIVEDDSATRGLLAAFLRESGCEVVEANSGEAAIIEFVSRSFHVVLMDVCLGSMSGTQAAKEIAKIAKERGDWLYLIYVTGMKLESHDLAVVERGVCDMMVKPVMLKALGNRIEMMREMVRTQEMLAESGMRLRNMLEKAVDGFVLLSLKGEIIEANRAAERIFHIDPGLLVGRQFIEFVPVDLGQNALAYQTIRRECLEECHPNVVTAIREDGNSFDLEIRLTRMYLANHGNCVAATFRDATGRTTHESAIQFVFNHDPLTSLPNRKLLQDRLAQALAGAIKHERKVALLHIDLDGFKKINDTWGHDAGDKALQEVAHRLSRIVRDTDTVCRQGGDEFLILLSEVHGLDDAMEVARRFLQAAQMGVRDRNHSYHLSASIGVTIAPDHGVTVEQLLKNADVAMNTAKESGKGKAVPFQSELVSRKARRDQIEELARRAITDNEFCLYYQPQIDFRTGYISGFEALVRWNHQGRMIMPGDFIPIIEEASPQIPLGRWAIREAASQWKTWQQTFPDRRIPRIAVNISQREFTPSLVKDVLEALKEFNIPSHALELEITETTLASDPKEVIRVMNDLRSSGVSMAVDDFGTGYSSLSCLKSYPIRTLKIDRAFVSDIANPDSAAIAGAIMSLSQHMNLKTVAEGVETEEQRDILLSMGCTAWQGYLCTKPLPPSELVEFCRNVPSRANLHAA